MEQNSQTQQKTEVLDTPTLEALRSKKMFYIGGCELSFMKEYLDNNFGSNSLLTYDINASPNPLFEIQDRKSKWYNFNADILIMSHNQQIRGYFQYLQLDENVTRELQDDQLNEIRATFNQSIDIVRDNEFTGPIVLFTYPLAYRPALGKFEYRMHQKNYSVIEFYQRLRLLYYETAKSHQDVYVLDTDEAFSQVSKEAQIRRLDANGIYEHVTREGSVYLGDELIKTMALHYNLGIKVKCVVMDLDNTLWAGIIQDDGISGVTVYENRIQILRMLRRRGILLALASKNEPGVEPLIADLLGDDFKIFSATRITWNDKAQSLQEIADELNIGIDSLAFFDDNPYERDMVRNLLPQVSVYSDDELLDALNRPEFDMGVITEVSKKRADMYIAQRIRDKDEKKTHLTKEEFLKSIGLTLWIREAKDRDLNRVAELIQRTNQLNATTIRHDRSKINEFHKSKLHKIFVCNLWDKYGEYGLIGVTIVEENQKIWDIDTLLFSCRAMGKTVERNTLSHLTQEGKKHKISSIVGKYKKTDRNEGIMRVFEDAEFTESGSSDEVSKWVFDLEGNDPLQYSPWITIGKPKN